MCGIAGIFSWEHPFPREELETLIQAQHHRGPDYSGYWTSPNQGFGLGHARLAMVDLEGGNQPIHNEDGTLHLVVSGEFYDFRRERERLQARGHKFQTASDSEIALHLFEDEGLPFLQRLRGEFALLLFDDKHRRVIAARDRFGVKPLFYSRRGPFLYFASEIKALLALGWPVHWDREAFFDYLHLGLPPDRTFFLGIEQVPPGCHLVAEERHLSVEPYWDCDFPTRDALAESAEESEWIARITDGLREAVTLRLDADVPVGCHLSGGVDSSAIAGIAAEHTPGLSLFSVGFEGVEFDETGIASRTAAKLGGHQIISRFQPAHFAQFLKETTESGEILQENSHGIARYQLSKAIHDHGFKAVLAGEGGDELFAGYGHFQKDLAFSRDASLRERVRASYDRLRVSGKAMPIEALMEHLQFLPNWILERFMTVTLPLEPFLSREFLRSQEGRNPYEQFLTRPSISKQLAGRTPLHQSMYLFIKTWLSNYLLAAERLDMAHSLELRLPMLDHHLFETAKNIPLNLYTRQDLGKYPLRLAARPYLTEEVFRGPKHAFFAPPLPRDAPTLEFLKDWFSSNELANNPFFDQSKICGALQGILAAPRAHRGYEEALLQIITGTCILQRRYGLRG